MAEAQKGGKNVCLQIVRTVAGFKRGEKAVVGFPYMFIRLITADGGEKKKQTRGKEGVGEVSRNGGCLTEKHCKILHTEAVR